MIPTGTIHALLRKNYAIPTLSLFPGEHEIWMLRNQPDRRNLNDYQRAEIALKLEDALKAQARERQLSTLKQNVESTVKENLPERSESGQREPSNTDPFDDDSWGTEFGQGEDASGQI